MLSNYTFSPQHRGGKNHHHLVIHSGLSLNNPDKDGESAVTEVVGGKELTKISSSSAHSAKQYNQTHPAVKNDRPLVSRDPNEIVSLES